MSPKSTVYKVELQISDLDRHYYQEHNLTLALHPSETEERMMVRLLAFAMNADERLNFGRGLSSDDEPDLWQRSDTGEIDLWIETGQPDEQRVRRACGRARHVLIYTYSGRSAQVWWEKVGSTLGRKNLTVIDLPSESVVALTSLAARTMRLQCMVEDHHVQLMNADGSVSIDPIVRVAAQLR
ncbi:MAG TPA: YaeQ family protein [Pseudomonadota bacterium]|nr:YaeQ family protein [Rhodanobacteraceae bacterium]MBP9154295.1 YaeQ family protein [Xanthomonadales bacterium]HQW80940.1 YaeQ family protein [Pseudomonadota bacterium]